MRVSTQTAMAKSEYKLVDWVRVLKQIKNSSLFTSASSPSNDLFYAVRSVMSMIRMPGVA